MSSREKKSCWVRVLIFGLLMASPTVAQYVDHGGIDGRKDSPRFSFFFGAGPALVDDFDHGSLALEVEPRFEVKRGDRNILEWTLPLLWLPGSRPLPGGEDTPLPDPERSGELEIGSSLAVVPSLVWSPGTLRCSSYSFFAGAGVNIERGRRSWLKLALADASGMPLSVTAETPDTVDPMVVLGVSWARVVGQGTQLRVKLRLFTTFYDERSVETDLGEVLVPSGHQSGVMITAGFRLGS